MTNIALGPFRLDARNDLLLHGTEPVALGRRAILLLRTLVAQAGALVSKDALIEAAWPAQIVEESNLTVQIAALRRALATVPGGSGWIETMPRRGYRFIGPVATEADNSVIASQLVRAGPASASTPYDDAERRQITAFSCELVRTSDQGNGASLEDLREAFGVFLHRVAEIVDRHDGLVVSRLGDAATALFGHPIAHEYDAEQAVRAGLELCAAVTTLKPGANVPMRCRVGIATGPAIIADLERSGTSRNPEIVGDAPGLAIRLRMSARLGSVAIEPATRRLIGDLFDCEDLGTIDMAASAEPLRIWQVLGANFVASRFKALRPAALTPLIGRDEEIDLLVRRWACAKAGEGQIVLISGEPGIGKSRITVEVEKRLQSEPHLELHCYCSPYHQNSVLFPFIDQLDRAAGFERDEPPAAKLAKLEGLLARTNPSGEDVALLADLLSLPASLRHPVANFSPQRKKEKALEALVRRLEGLARQQPLVAIFEDAQWIDATSRELLDLTIERVRTLPVLLIVTFRSEFPPPWTGQPGVTTLVLNRLDRRERIALVSHIAGGKALPDEVLAHIADRTDGVPLFVEEVTKSILESGLLREEPERYVLDKTLPPVAIPTSLNASLLARLDHLASARTVAQVGAAIGREFSYVLLRAVSRLPDEALQSSLRRLVGSELVFQRGTPPAAVYSFKHALVQDAAHNTLLRGARRRLHRQIAEALEAQFPELIENAPELLAQHYTEAGLLEKSAVLWGNAGERSVARSAIAEAATQFRKGLDQLALLPVTAERQRQELEFCVSMGSALQAVKGLAAPETGGFYSRAREIWEQLGFPPEFRHLPYLHSLYYASRGELDRALRLDEDLLHAGREVLDSGALVLGHLSRGRNLTFAGKFAQSQTHLQKALELYHPISHQTLVQHAGLHPNSAAAAYLGFTLLFLGHPDRAIEQSDAAITAARQLAHPYSLALSLAFGTMLRWLSNDDAEFERLADQLIAIATEQRFTQWESAGSIFCSWIKVKNGDVGEGISQLASGAAAYRNAGSAALMPLVNLLHARALEIAGRVEDAISLLDETLWLVVQTGEHWFDAELHRQKGDLLLRQGNTATADDLYRKALSVAVGQGAKLWELRATTSLARLLDSRGRRAEARGYLTPVYRWFTEGFDTTDVKQAQALLDELA